MYLEFHVKIHVKVVVKVHVEINTKRDVEIHVEVCVISSNNMEFHENIRWYFEIIDVEFLREFSR